MASYSSGVRCALTPCRSRYDSKKSFFGFPKDPIRCAQWIKMCNPINLPTTDPNDLVKNYKLCSLHFQNHMFSNYQKNRLFPSAVPTVFDDKPKKIPYRYCAVKYCGVKISVKKMLLNVHFFNLPKDPTRRAIWIKNCFPEITDQNMTLQHVVVCQEHFEDKMFLNINRKNRLTDFAVPTLFNDYILAKRAGLKDDNSCSDVPAPVTCSSPSHSSSSSFGLDGNFTKSLNKELSQKIVPRRNMTTMCCVPGCQSIGRSKNPKIKYFRFPKDEARRLMWLKAIQREDFVPANNSLICNNHFTNDDYQKRPGFVKLTNTAVPSVFNCVENAQNTVKKYYNNLSDHTYVLPLPESPEKKNSESGDTFFDPSTYMVQTLKVIDNLKNEPMDIPLDLSCSNEQTLKDKNPYVKITKDPLKNLKKNWKEIAVAQTNTIKNLRKKIKILQERLRRHTSKIKTIK